jgi:hypothetical protein
LTADQYGKAITTAAPDELRQAAWLSRAHDRRPGTDEEVPERGRLLWLHPVHILQGTPDFTRRTAEAMAPAFSKTIDLDGGVFVAGIGWSVVGVTQRNAENTPVKLTKLHWAYYALYMEIDRGLLDILNEPRWRQGARLKDLETHANEVFADYARVVDARARLDSALNASGGDELTIWETISEVQKFDSLLKAVVRKLDALDKVAQRRIEQTTAVRNRHIGHLLGSLAVLGLVTLTTAIVGAVAGSISPGQWSVKMRLWLIVGAVVLAVLLFLAFFIRTARVPGSYPRR